MENLVDFALEERYKSIKHLGDRLSEFSTFIDWERFRTVVGDIYQNQTEQGGRPNMDIVLMIKMLVLQSMYNLSDPELERQANDRISFMKFLDYPEKIPDQTTVWYFRERLAKTGKDKAIWEELQRQLDAKGLKIRKGTIQDATFITADPGHASTDTPREEDAKTRRSRDGTWTKKGKKSYFGYKLHTKEDCDFGLIRALEVTTASTHDSQVDLSKEGEVIYRDRRYFGTKTNGFNATMQRGVRGHPIGIRDILRNARISRIRSPGERPYAIIKNVFHSAHTRVTTVLRVHAKMVFTAFTFNLFQLATLKKQGVLERMLSIKF
ncbi:MAG: IS5 family transposase [Methanoregula sp.]|jgi:IS5 family transposase|uniref:IS5 family transposase n=1 Tax=Methanoregula sp. TaxID=2052170 RepID=UPI0025D23348|nr:IS5 family transposase [Methanoregula sp.]MCK9632842.1 IS5 family transposase [Methanoregula sp.]